MPKPSINLSKLSQREKRLVGFLLIALSTIPFFQFTLPAWNQYSELSQGIGNDQRRLNDLDFQIKRLEKFKKENLELTKKIELKRAFLAKSYETDFLVSDIKKICDESSLSLNSFTPTNPEPVNIVLDKQLESNASSGVGTYTRLKQALDKLKGQDLPIDLYKFPIEIRISGSFSDTVELFKKLETYGRIISVNNISIGKIDTKKSFDNRLSKSKKKPKEEEGDLTSSFDLIAYSLPSTLDEKLPVNQVQKSFTIKRKR